MPLGRDGGGIPSGGGAGSDDDDGGDSDSSSGGSSSNDSSDDDGGGSSPDYGGGTGLRDDTQDTGARGGADGGGDSGSSSGGSSSNDSSDDSSDDDGGGSSPDYGGGTGLRDDTQDTGAQGGADSGADNDQTETIEGDPADDPASSGGETGLRDDTQDTGAQGGADDRPSRTIEGNPPEQPDTGGGTGLTDTTQDIGARESSRQQGRPGLSDETADTGARGGSRVEETGSLPPREQTPPTTADGPYSRDAGVEPSRPEPANDEAILSALRGSIASRREDVTESEVTVTDFDQRDGEVVPVFSRAEDADPVDAVPQEFRNDLRDDAVTNTATADADEASVVVADDGAVTVEFGESVDERRERNVAATELDARYPDVDIGLEDLRTSDDGTLELTEEASAEVRAATQSDAVASPGVLDQEMDRAAQQEAAEQAAQGSGERQPPAPEPSAAATAVGGTAEAIGDSPIGSAVEAASDPIFGDIDDREDGLVGEIDTFLEDVETGFETRITDRIESADPDVVDARTYGGVRPFGISGEDAQEMSVKFAQFSNPGSIGRDFVTAAEAGASARQFLFDRGPEGAQIAADVAAQGASAAPGATRAAIDEAIENPRDTATTGTALLATFGAGAVASGAARSSASVAARGARAGARRADDVVDVARTRGGSIRERAPDISVRRDPNSGPLEVDPMLQQQLRNRVRGGADVVTETADADASLARRIGAATERAQINARFNADATVSRVRDAVPDRSSIPDRPSGPDGSLARQAGRTTRRAELNALLNADAATSRLRAAVPDRDSVPGTNVFTGGDEPLARRAGRRFESERQSLRLAAAAAPSAVRSRTADAAEQLEELVPSRPGGLSFSDSPASLARRAGRRFESERRSLELTAAAAPSAARARVSNAGDRVLDRAEEIAGRPREALENAERPELDLDLGLRDRSVPRPDQRVRDAVAAASEATVRIGPIRPGRTDVEIGDLDLDLDRFDEDALDLGLGGSGGGGGRGSDAIDLDLDADVDAGGTGAGSDQIAAVRTTRRGSRDADLDGAVRARERSAGGPDVGRVDALAGISDVAAGVFGGRDMESEHRGAQETAFDPGTVEEPFGDVGAAEDLGFEALSPGLNLGAPPTNMIISGPTNMNISGPTSTTTTATEVPMETTSMTDTPPGRTSSPPFRPPRAPSFDLPGGDRSDDGFTADIDIEDDTFDTGVADADEAFENLF